MAKKDTNLAKLEEAVSKQADSLDPAQCAFVLAQFEHYRWNEEQIAELEEEYAEVKRELERSEFESLKDRKAVLEERGTIHRQRHQLVAEQGALFTHIMRWLKGTASEPSKLDEFFAND